MSKNVCLNDGEVLEGKQEQGHQNPREHLSDVRES